MVEDTKVGGLSDLDYDGENFYAICDLPSSPRIYKMSISIDQAKIDTIIFDRVINIPHKTSAAKTLFWDSEGLVYNKKEQKFILSSEGAINNKKDPFIAELDSVGNLNNTYELPNYFKATAKKGLRNNGVFEGLSYAVDSLGIWVSTELPMKSDGPTSKLYRTTSPIRVTYFNTTSKSPVKQFAYLLGSLRNFPLLPFGINGVSAILEYDSGQFLVLERSFIAGHGFGAQLFLANSRQASNTLDKNNLRKKIKKKEITPAEKRLLFDFRSIRRQLHHKKLDNLEGIALGPKLANGHQTLILISDNNFNSPLNQLNQVILMEIIPE